MALQLGARNLFTCKRREARKSEPVSAVTTELRVHDDRNLCNIRLFRLNNPTFPTDAGGVGEP